MNKYKLGLRHFKHTLMAARRMMILAAHLDQLGMPPAQSYQWAKAVEANVGDNWELFLNDRYGDCVIADNLHFLMILLANGLGPFELPTDDMALKLYEEIAGFDPDNPSETDNGTQPDANLLYMVKTGTGGHKYNTGAQVATMNHRMWATHLFGGLRYCIQCPDFVEDAFEKGIWDYQGQSYRVEGGHDIRCVQYTVVDGVPVWDIITWGRRIKMTEAFWHEFGMVGEADISQDLVMKSGVSAVGLNLQGMLDKLVNVGE